VKFRTIVPILLIILVVGLSMACNTGTNPAVPGHGVLKNVSAALCVGCHIELGDEWGNTAHATAEESLLSSDHAGDYCFPCHTVSLDGNPANSGYDDLDPEVAARFGGVQCEACHGPGSDHIATREPMLSNFGADLCGDCHTGGHHPTYDEWAVSAHAVALSLPRETNSHFSTHCLECHSADYIFADSIPEDATPFDFEFGITCAVCHDPHSDENEYQLRKPIVPLCAECHTAGGASPGSNPHHPNGDIFQGTGGYEYPGEDYENSAHTIIENGCAACHMWTSPFNATGQDEDAISGHTFLPLVQACQECHSSATDFDLYGFQTNIANLFAQLEAELDAATDNDKLTLSYERAEFNLHLLEADGSHGIHNPLYVSKLLQDSIDDFEPGS